MDIVIGYESALDYWRTVGPTFLVGYRERQTATRRARGAMATTGSQKPRLSGGNRRPAGSALPVQVLVGTPEARTKTTNVVSHVWSDGIPDKSVVDAGEGFLMSTPEFCFLQMASVLSLGCLIQVGFELCGTYALIDDGPARRRPEPLTSLSKLSAFLEAAPNARGRAKARRALRYIMEGSASPMETVLAMLLCLPYNLGGYGIERPQLNYHVSITDAQRQRADRRYCECDLCWPDRSLCIEYDSTLYHAQDDKRESDARRRATLITLGFTVITVSRGQVMDSGAFNRLAGQVAKLTGKRLRYQDPQFTRNHLALRAELLGALGIGLPEVAQ